MLDIKLMREQPDLVKDGLRKVGGEPTMVDEVLRLDGQRRELLFEVEQLKAAKNAASKEIGKIKDPVEREQRIAAMRAQGDRIPELDKQVSEVEAALEQQMLELPNLPHPDVPGGHQRAR
jgi:seryl-tRNA synthetase